MTFFRIFRGLPEATMVFKRFLGAVLSAALLLSSASLSVYADQPSSTPDNTTPVSFTDIDAHWAKEAIERWANMGVIVGEDGKFRPDDPLTRAEMAVILVRIMRYQTASTDYFLDLEEDWYVDAIQKLRAAGVMKGDENNCATPNEPITREAAVSLIARAFGIAPTESELSYTDAQDISSWAAGYVCALSAAGYVHGGDNNCFFPADNLTRAEAVTIFNNMITACIYESGNHDFRPFEGLADFVIVGADNVNILNFDIGGNILLTEGVDAETVRLKTVKHYGEIWQHVPGGFKRHLKVSSYIVPVNEHLPVCSYDPSLFIKDDNGIMTYADPAYTTYFGVDGRGTWTGTS